MFAGDGKGCLHTSSFPNLMIIFKDPTDIILKKGTVVMLLLHEASLKIKSAWGIFTVIRDCFKGIPDLSLDSHGRQTTFQELEIKTWKLSVNKHCQLFSKY